MRFDASGGSCIEIVLTKTESGTQIDDECRESLMKSIECLGATLLAVEESLADHIFVFVPDRELSRRVVRQAIRNFGKRTGVSLKCTFFESSSRTNRLSHALAVSDLFAIRLEDGRYAYAQYVASETGWGDFIHIFDMFTAHIVTAEIVIKSNKLFSPILVAMKSVVKQGRWKYIGNIPPIQPFELPRMRLSTEAAMHGVSATYSDWTIYDFVENRWQFIGRLPPPLRSLEFFVSWDHAQIVERITSGVNPFDNYS